MSIASELTRLQQAKADIKAAIVAKGVEVPDSALISVYDDYIAQIEGGGGCSVASANSITFDAMGRVSSVSYKEGVTEIPDYMFSNDTSLTSVTLPSTLTRIGNSAFNNCGGLTSVTIPEGVTAIGWMAFNGCTGLTSVVIPSTVTSIGSDAFYGCRGLTAITVNAIVPPTGSAAFGNTDCPIYVPCDSVDAYKAATNWSNYASRIQCSGSPTPTPSYKYAFYGTNGNLVQSGACNSSGDLGVYGGDSYDLTVRSQVITAVVGECVTSFTNSFSNCSAMTDVTILSTGLTAINEYSFNWCYALTGLTIPSTVTTLGQQAFYGCRSLTDVNLPSGVTSIPVYCFKNCWSLTGLSMPSVTTIGNYAFDGCSALTSVNLPQTLTTIGESAFGNCSGLTSITIPASVTSIGNHAFSWCTGLTGITVEATTPPTIGTGIFSDSGNCPIYVPCESLDAYKAATNWSNYASRIQSSGCTIRMSGTSVSGSSFQIRINDGAENINAVVDTVPNQDGTYNWTAEYDGTMSDITSTTRMFANTPIASIDWGTFRPTELGTQMFLSAKLTAFTIPDSVTTIQSAAVNNNRLTSLTIPTGVTTINGDAFAANSRLTGITFLSTTVPNGINWSTFAGSTCPIYVPCNSYTSYRSMANSAFSERVTPSGGGTRWITAEGQTSCVDGIDIYSVLKLQYSCDNENWIDAGVTKTGTKISDGYRRWVTVQGEYICEDGDKYEMEKEQGSCDNENWTDTGNSRKGTLIETGSQDCQYSCDCQYNFCGEDAVGEEFTVNNGTNEIKSTDFDSHSPVRGTVGSLTTTIREYCFGRSLEEITLCNSVTTIEHEAFNECENLASITIPSSVQTIGFWAFTRCSSLQEVIFEGTTPPTFSGDGGDIGGAIYNGFYPSVTYVPDSALSDYRAISNWVNDAQGFDPTTNIRPISERV